MHYCILVITKDFPTNEVIEQKLAPYYEYATDDEAAENPPIRYDRWGIGGRYCGMVKLRVDRNVENVYEWAFYAKTPRAGRLYRSMMFEELNNKKPVPWFNEECYQPYLGYHDGYLWVDGAKISDVINFEELVTDHGYAFIGKDDEIFCRNYYNGKEWIDNLDYENQVREATKNVQDCYVTIIDAHR